MAMEFSSNNAFSTGASFVVLGMDGEEQVRPKGVQQQQQTAALDAAANVGGVALEIAVAPAAADEAAGSTTPPSEQAWH